MNILQLADDFRHQENSLYRAIDALEECKSEVFRVTAIMGNEGGKCSTHSNSRELALVRYITAKECLENCIAKYAESCLVFNNAMDTIDDPDDMNIIYYRHRRGMTWKQTAAAVGLSQRMVYLKYEKIVRYLSVKTSENEATAKP